MAIIRIFTDDGQEVASMKVGGDLSDTAVARHVVGNLHPIQGWLGRAIDDARIIQAGGDPERPSEKAMRLTQAKRQRVHIDTDDDGAA